MTRAVVVHTTTVDAAPKPWRDMTPHERLNDISNRFVFTKPIKELLRKLKSRVEEIPSSKSKRVIVLSGPEGTGKTALAQHLAESYAAVDEDGVDQRTVVLTSPTFKVDAASLADAVVRDVNWPVRPRLSGERSPEKQMDWVLDKSRARMLIFTRADFLAPNGEDVAPQAIPFLVRLMDRPNHPTLVLVASSPFAAKIARHSKLADKLTNLELRPLEYGKRWLRAVEQYDAMLPFVIGGLTSTGMPEMLYLATAGKLPLLSGLSVEAGRFALFGAKRADRLSKEHFHLAFSEFRPGSSNPFAGEHKVEALIAEINRKAGVTVEDLIPDDGED
jgi:hypothetical protein